VVGSVLDPMTINIEILEQLLRLAKAAHGQQMRMTATTGAAVTMAAAPSPSTSSTYDPIVPAAADGSSVTTCSYEGTSQGTVSPLRSDAGSDTAEGADRLTDMEITADELIEQFFPSTASSQNMTGPASEYRSVADRIRAARRAGGMLEAAKTFSDQISALNTALAAKLNVTLAT